MRLWDSIDLKQVPSAPRRRTVDLFMIIVLQKWTIKSTDDTLLFGVSFIIYYVVDTCIISFSNNRNKCLNLFLNVGMFFFSPHNQMNFSMPVFIHILFIEGEQFLSNFYQNCCFEHI